MGALGRVLALAVAAAARPTRSLRPRPRLLASLAGDGNAYVRRVEVGSAAEMEELGKRLSRGVGKGDTILLSGTLGVGKTTLARGFIRGCLGDDSAVVTSPTYLLDNTYEAGAFTVHHMDLYRLKQGADLSILGIAEAVRDCVCLFEWAEGRIDQLLPPERLEIRIEQPEDEIEGGDNPDGLFVSDTFEEGSRNVQLAAHGDRWRQRIDAAR